MTTLAPALDSFLAELNDAHHRFAAVQTPDGLLLTAYDPRTGKAKSTALWPCTEDTLEACVDAGAARVADVLGPELLRRTTTEIVDGQPTACFDGAPMADRTGRALPGFEAVWAALEDEADRNAPWPLPQEMP